MTQDETEVIGKNVKDMYGTAIGRIIGTSTDIDGSVKHVGVDCGFQGLQQIPYEQLVVQPDVVIFIPKWRLDSQRLLREKQLTLRRLNALVDIVSENDDMKEDAEIIHSQYKSKLAAIDETEKMVCAKLESRLADLGEQTKTAKMLLFDARVQFKGGEISEGTFDTVKTCTSDMLEHTQHEIKELQGVQQRIADLASEEREMMSTEQPLQDSAMSYLNSHDPAVVQSILPEAPTASVPAEPTHSGPEHLPTVPAFGTGDREESSQPVRAPAQQKEGTGDDWLARMEAQ